MIDINKEINILIGDNRQTLKEVPDNCVNCIVTSPPYFGLRSYTENTLEIGREVIPPEYIDNLMSVFTECYRVLRDDGVMFINIGDTYNGNKKGNTETNKNIELSETSVFEKKKWESCKTKDLIGIPFMLAFALRDAGWYWRDMIIWAKATSGIYIHGTCMPESVKDRCNKAHEYIMMFTKSDKYYYDWESISEKQADVSLIRARAINHNENRKNNGDYQYTINTESQTKSYEKLCKQMDENPDKPIKRIRRSVWTIPSKNSSVNHFAIYPSELAEPCILAGCPKDGIVLDPFGGSGTTSAIATLLDRKAIHCELNENAEELYKQRKLEIISQRLSNDTTIIDGKIKKTRSLW